MREAKKLARAKKLAKARAKLGAASAGLTRPLPRCALLPTRGALLARSLGFIARRAAPPSVFSPRPSQAAERSKNPEDEDPELQEFLSLMQPRSKQKAWADGAAPGAAGRRAAPGGAADGAEDGDAEARAAGGEASSSDDEDYQELPAAKGKGKGTKAAEAGGQGGKKAKGKGKGGAGGEDDFDFMDDTAEEGEGGEEEGDDGEEEPAAEEKDLGVSVRCGRRSESRRETPHRAGCVVRL